MLKPYWFPVPDLRPGCTLVFIQFNEISIFFNVSSWGRLHSTVCLSQPKKKIWLQSATKVLAATAVSTSILSFRTKIRIWQTTIKTTFSKLTDLLGKEWKPKWSLLKTKIYFQISCLKPLSLQKSLSLENVSVISKATTC